MIRWLSGLLLGLVDVGVRLMVELIRGILRAPLTALQGGPARPEEE